MPLRRARMASFVHAASLVCGWTPPFYKKGWPRPNTHRLFPALASSMRQTLAYARGSVKCRRSRDREGAVLGD